MTELVSTKWDSKAGDSIKMCGWAGEWLPSVLWIYLKWPGIFLPPIDRLILVMIFAQVRWVTPAELHWPTAILLSTHEKDGNNEESSLSIGFVLIINLLGFFLCPSLYFFFFFSLAASGMGVFHKISCWSNSGAQLCSPRWPRGGFSAVSHSRGGWADVWALAPRGNLSSECSGWCALLSSEKLRR